jgi:hypothetical protein
MLAQVLALQFGSMVDGEHGGSSQGGKMRAETLAGQKQLAHSSINAQRAIVSKFSATTGKLSRAGGKAGAETGPPIPFSNGSMSLLPHQNAPSLCAMYPVLTTQQMAHPPSCKLATSPDMHS